MLVLSCTVVLIFIFRFDRLDHMAWSQTHKFELSYFRLTCDQTKTGFCGNVSWQFALIPATSSHGQFFVWTSWPWSFFVIFPPPHPLLYCSPFRGGQTEVTSDQTNLDHTFVWAIVWNLSDQRSLRSWTVWGNFERTLVWSEADSSALLSGQRPIRARKSLIRGRFERVFSRFF